MDAIRIQAKFVLGGRSNLLHPGQVVIRNGRIEQVTASISQRPDLDLGDSVLMPGFVNVHSHLEFSHLSRPIPLGQRFPHWIGNVVAHRRQLESNLAPADLDRFRAQAYVSGLSEAFASGTCLIGDIVSLPWTAATLPSPEDVLQSASKIVAVAAFEMDIINDISEAVWHQHLQGACSPRVHAFPEVIGLTDSRLSATATWAEEQYCRFKNPALSTHDLLAAVGVSPHAPYSLLYPEFEPLLLPLADAVTAMHLAESEDELEWLQSGTGAFRESFDRLGIPIPARLPSVHDMINLLGSRPRSLLVHGNYLTQAHAQHIARSPSISLVYCPRTHAYFGHTKYPLSMFREQGIRVVLATDSRASNPDLNLWSEVAEARRCHADLAPQEAFAAVTSEAAAALGMDECLGELKPGMSAHMNVVASQSHWSELNLLEEMTSQPLCCTPLAALQFSR